VGATRNQPSGPVIAFLMLGTTAGGAIMSTSVAIIGEYYLFLWPLPLLAAALGVAAAREWNRPAQRAFVVVCLAVIVASAALILFQPHP
jgi:hypothetical protein